MTQPAGRVCGKPAKHRLYLRVSPFVCLADTLSIIIHLLAYKFTLRQRHRLSFYECYQVILKDRFDLDEDLPEDHDALHPFDTRTWLRWVFFVFGAVPPAVKLFAMKNLLWTQAFGYMFFLSFIAIEILLGCSYEYVMLGSSETSAALQRVKRHLAIMDKWLFTLAVDMHLIVLWTSIAHLLSCRVSSCPIALPEHSAGPNASISFGIKALTMFKNLLINLCMPTITIMSGASIFAVMPELSLRSTLYNFSRIAIFNLIMIASALYTLTTLDFGNTFASLSGIWMVGLFYGMTQPYILWDEEGIIIGLIPFFILPWIWFNMKDLFAEEEEGGEEGEDGEVGEGEGNDWTWEWMEGWIHKVVMYGSILFAVLWYAFCYDSVGTVNPSWTSIFG